MGGRAFDLRAGVASEEVRVDTITTNGPNGSTATTLSDGRRLFTRTDRSPTVGDASDGVVGARLLTADGRPSVAESASTHDRGGSSSPTAAALPDGGVVVAWTDDSRTGADTSRSAVRARILTADGRPSVAEVLVDATTGGGRSSPTVAAVPDGGVVVAWTDDSRTGTDNSRSAVRARILDAPGRQTVPEVLVNTHRFGVPSEPGLAVLAEGRIVATRSDDGGSLGDASPGASTDVSCSRMAAPRAMRSW